jgi:Rod binding domain-containing protein
MSELSATIDNTITQYQAGQFNKKIASAQASDQDAAALAAQDFESVFISQMLTPMFEGIEPDGIFGGGTAENIYKSMMLEEYGKLIAANGSIGVADAVKAEIIAMQERSQGDK